MDVVSPALESMVSRNESTGVDVEQQTKTSVSDFFWNQVDRNQEQEGHDRESFEQSLRNHNNATAQQHPVVRTNFIQTTMPAEKALQKFSLHPMLGIECTLPQHRLRNSCVQNSVQQNEYPVWYFFCGILCEDTRLCSVMGHADSKIVHYPAKVHNAALKIWAGKELGLTDGDGTVEGQAYLVKSEAEEARLRHYETDRYEVARCRIEMQGGWEQGLTFRFLKTELD